MGVCFSNISMALYPHDAFSAMNNNNNNCDYVYGAIVNDQSPCKSSPGSELRVAANPQTNSIHLGCESAKNWLLPSTSTIAVVIVTQP